MTRREAREQALSMIFEMNFNDNSVDEMVDNALIFRDESVDEYAVQIAQQVRLHWEDNLSAVEQYSKKWKANRLPKVSLAILMLAITEIAYVKDAPVGAVINEAVESMLARRMLPTSMACWAVMFVERWAKQPSLRKPKNDSGECCGRWVAGSLFAINPNNAWKEVPSCRRKSSRSRSLIAM